MNSIFVKSSNELKKINLLLNKGIPSYRQAYSDRTSWIMACLSELVYIKFNEPIIHKNNTKLVNIIEKLLDEKKVSSLKKLISIAAYDSQKEKEKLISDLQIINMDILKTFDCNGTQAVIVSNSEFYVLVFRGTEATSIADIKADLKAQTMKCEHGGKIHSGFNDAFGEVYVEIQTYLDTLEEEKPLFITGHSLGGALAIVATKKLDFKHGLAGCYTYGSPRVGDEEWMYGIKTPIYRIVNSADPVTMLPPGADTINVISWMVKFIPYVGKNLSVILLSKFGGYYHAGDMRYLTNVDTGDYGNSKLLYHVNFMRRIKAYIFNKINILNIPKDHSIEIYRKKLKCIAMEKNNNS